MNDTVCRSPIFSYEFLDGHLTPCVCVLEMYFKGWLWGNEKSFSICSKLRCQTEIWQFMNIIHFREPKKISLKRSVMQ